MEIYRWVDHVSMFSINNLVGHRQNHTKVLFIRVPFDCNDPSVHRRAYNPQVDSYLDMQ
jgi:hypothetical protein